MPDGLTPRATVLLVGLAFGLTFCIQTVVGGASSPARPAEAKQAVTRAASADAPAADPDLRLVAAGTVPALREPRKSRKPHKRRVRAPKRAVRKVVMAAPTVDRAPVVPTATAQPVATAAPRYVPPPPRRTPTPKPTQTPASTPPSSGEFDSGEFDTSGER